MVKAIKKIKKKIIKIKKTTAIVRKPILKKKSSKILLKKKKPFTNKNRALKLSKNKKTISKTKTKVKRTINKKIKKTEKKKLLTLKRSVHNPIIAPRLYEWESKATFNPTAFESDGKVHIIYRAIGDDDSSVLGYALSSDGINIDERPTHSIYRRFYQAIKSGFSIDYVSGGGWNGGCEDPRLTLIGDTIYMLYTAFDGWGSVRIALTSIPLADFKKKKWNWQKSVLISPPGEIHKNWVLFPEKINGKFAIIHSISPKISIEYVDDLRQFDGKKFIKSNYSSQSPWKDSWDNMVRGVGPSPIKTTAGWLVLYHSMDRNDPDRYKLGAMVLDFKDPTKILYHSKHPILEPDEYYENEGYKWGVIYSCGAVVKDGILFVYYGGADKFVCVASTPLDALLDSLKKDKVITFKNNLK